jgi:hypothetical protein
MALSADKLRQSYQAGNQRNLPTIAASVTIWEGALVSVDILGHARPARATSSDRVVGIATRRIPSQVGAGAPAAGGGVDVDPQIALLKNSGSTDAITILDINCDCYVVDDETVARTSLGSTRPRAGRVSHVDSTGVYVDLMAQPTQKATVGPLRITDVSADSDSATGYAPFAGRVIEVWGVLGGAITAADATIAPEINTVTVTGALTVANVGSGANVKSFMHPTGANIVARGDTLVGDSAGESSTTATFDVFFIVEAF